MEVLVQLQQSLRLQILAHTISRTAQRSWNFHRHGLAIQVFYSQIIQLALGIHMQRETLIGSRMIYQIRRISLISCFSSTVSGRAGQPTPCISVALAMVVCMPLGLLGEFTRATKKQNLTFQQRTSHISISRALSLQMERQISIKILTMGQWNKLMPLT